MIEASLAGRRAFILENTRLQAPPHTPELALHLADEITPIWKLTEEALAEIGLPPPFWAFAWAGGQALARYILDHPETVAGKRVIDFASGSGLVAIAAMKAGAASVLAADIDVFCEAAIGVNAEGYREILGICEGAKEDKSGWSAFLRHLVDRGLRAWS